MCYLKAQLRVSIGEGMHVAEVSDNPTTNKPPNDRKWNDGTMSSL